MWKYILNLWKFTSIFHQKFFFGENYIFEISFACQGLAWDSYFSDANLIFSLFSASSGGAGAGTVGNNDNSESFEQGSEVAGGSRSSSAAAAEVEEIEEKHHPHFDRALMRSRRKSVSFAVCKVNKDTMQFDIEHKSVLLNKRGSGGGNGASGIGLPGGSSKSSKANSPLRQVAKKWRDAKNKLVLKDTLSNIWPGMARKDEFEDEETFRNRRQELMEKAKALENQASKQRQTQNDSDNDETTM